MTTDVRNMKMKRRVLLGGSVGQFIEFYDFTLYGITAVIFAEKFFPGNSVLVGLLATFAAYGVAFVIRPLGGLYFGALGDRIGRRKVLAITLLTIGGATTLMGLLPTAETIGVWAPVLLVLCRLIQGFSAGGESVGAPSFVFEHAPINRRGLWINTTIAATALPSVFAGGLILGLSSILPAGGYEDWGWRLPFLLALPMSVFGVWIRIKTVESEAFVEAAEATPHEFSPVRETLRSNKLGMLQVIFVMGLTAMGFYFLSGYFPSYVQTAGELSREASLGANASALLLYAILMPIAGAVGDRVGRRPMLIAGSAALAVLVYPCFLLVTSGDVALAMLGQLLIVLPMCLYGGGCYPFFVEIFSTRTRFTSAAISYNVAYALFGGTAPLVGTWLVGASGYAAAPGVYFAITAAIVFTLVIVTKVPETRGRTD